jgi:hypothetical protein
MAKKISSSDLFEQEDLFKGVRDSATKTLAVFNELQAELKATAQGLKSELSANTQASTAQLKQFSAASEQANKLMKQAVEIEKLKAQADQQKIKAEQEIVKLQKMQAQELARVAKEQEKAAKLAQSESSAYAKLSKELNNARKAYKDLAVTNQTNTQEAKDLLETITRLDGELKKVDATVGQHQRNVGNYEGATRNLKTELRALTRELMNMDSADPKFQEMTQRAGELKDQISDTQAVVKATAGSAMENFASSTAKVGQIGVAAFQGVEASMQLIGVENENILEGMRRLQALAGLGDALKTLGALGDTLTEIRAGFVAAASKMGLFTAAKNTDTIATNQNTIAVEANNAAQNTASKSTGLLGIAMKAIPYVAIAAAIGTVVYAIYEMVAANKEAEITAKARKQVEEENLRLTQEMNANLAQETSQFKLLTTQLLQTNAGSKERKDLIDKINSTYGTTLKNLSDEAAFQAQVNATVQDYMNMMKAKVQIDMNVKKHTQTIQDQADAQDRLLKYQIELNKIEAELSKVGKNDYWMEKKKLTMQRDSVLSNIASVQEQIKIQDELQQIYAQQNLDLQKNVDLNKYQPPTPAPPPVQQQQNYNNALQQTVDLSRQIVDEQIKLIEDTNRRESTQLIVEAERRIEDINKTIADQKQKSQLIIEVKNNLIKDLDELDNAWYKEQLEKQKIEEEKRLKLQQEIDFARIKAKNDFLNKMEEITEANTRRTMSDQAIEEREVTDKYYELEQLAKGDAEALAQIEIAKMNELNDIRLKYQKIKDDNQKESAEKEKELEKKKNEELWQTTQEFAQKTTDFFKQRSDERIAQIEKEIAAAEQQADYYRQLAANGNINAQESLAEQERIIAESNRRKEREQKRAQRIELANTIYQTYAGHAAKDPDTALMKTIKDATLLQAFISSLPMFYDGTEDTGKGGGIDGKGGFHAVLHPHERVIPKSLNDQIGSLTNEQLTRLAMEYNNGRLVGKDVAHSSMDLAIMVNELRDLKEVIKQKPETNIELGQITQSAMEIVQSSRKGNTTVYNRFKVRK